MSAFVGLSPLAVPTAHASDHIEVSRVTDINPGSGNAGIFDKAALGDYLYFSATDGTTGHELWRSNGSTTEQVADINPGSGHSDPQDLTHFSGHLYFTPNNAYIERKLWRTDGSTTAPVADTNAAGADFVVLGAVFADHLYFSANDAVSGQELWRTDGSTVEQVIDINPGIYGSSPQWMTVIGDHLYFRANDGSTGWELWRTDGSTTQRVTDIAGSTGHVASAPVALGNHLYFRGTEPATGDELWRTDGSTTELLADIYPGSASSTPQFASRSPITASDGRLYFSANDGSTGSELWQTDGSTTGRVADLNPGSASSIPIDPVVFAGDLYFRAEDGASGRELFRADGLTIERVADLNPGSASSSPGHFMVFGQHLYFGADDGVSGHELWRSDGSTLEQVADIASGSMSSQPNSPIAVGNYLYFIANDGSTGFELWRTDGLLIASDTTAPLVSSVAASPNPAPVNEAITLTASVDDAATGGSAIASAQYSLDGGATWSSMRSADASFDETVEEVTAQVGPFSTAEVFDVCVRGTDTASNTSDPACILLAVFDPAAGFVTGTGWIQSPNGALKTVPDASGLANFGFVSRYKKGATVPEGTTQFRFRAGEFIFESTSYEWLVISGGTARFKGSGTVNNGGEYGFILSASDSSVAGSGAEDTFRLQVWDKLSDETLYDNGSQQPIGAGEIKVHSGSK